MKIFLSVLLLVSCKTPSRDVNRANLSAPQSAASASAPASGQRNQEAQKQALALEGVTRPRTSEAPPAPLPPTNADLTDRSQPGFIGSCVVTTPQGPYCMQDSRGRTLFFCAGEVSVNDCVSSRYTQTCKKVRAAPTDASDRSSQSTAQGVTFYFAKNAANHVPCDDGTIRSL